MIESAVRRLARYLWVLVVLGGPSNFQAQTRPASAVENWGANLPAQRIGPNDLIALSVYGAPEFSRTIRVSADGKIRIPILQRLISAGGLLPGDLESAIAEALSAEQILVSPAVTVTVVEYQSRPVSVAGAVKNPTTFQASGTMTLLEAITRAGGFSPEVGSEILVSRIEPGQDGAAAISTRRIALKSLIGDADPESNIKLLGGEEIRILEAWKVFVLGNIKKPGAYPMREPSEATVIKMLAVAEGLTPYASKTAYIIRRDERTGARQELPVELNKILKRQAADIQLVANDILYLPDNSGRRLSMSALEKITGFGAATASGVIIWGRPGR